jgi:hypothetical protein
MATIQRVNFEPVTDVLPIHRRDFPLADPTLAQPLNALALVDGEWMTLTNDYKIQRASAIANVGAAATVRSFPLWAERGRYDVQAIAGTRMPILFLGHYEFDTRVFDAAAVVGAGAAITQVMQPLKVATVAIGGRNYSGLVGAALADAAPIVGYVTRLPTANGGKLRFISGGRV